MMKLINAIGILLLLFSMISCMSKNVDFELEKTVLTQITPSLVDSICMDSRLVEPPPMLGKFVEDEKGYTFLDSTNVTKEQLISYANWKKRKEVAKKDTSRIIIAFNPLMKNTGNYFFKRLLKEYPISDFSLKGKDTIRSFVFDFNKIKLNNKFKLKNISEFPKTDNHQYLLFELKYDFVFSGIFTISRIHFDKAKNKGLMEASFSYCGRCGCGYNVYIKKVNGVWVIDRLEGTWIS